MSQDIEPMFRCKKCNHLFNWKWEARHHKCDSQEGSNALWRLCQDMAKKFSFDECHRRLTQIKGGSSNEIQIEKAFAVLEMHGVPRSRAHSVANGIEVLVNRLQKE